MNKTSILPTPGLGTYPLQGEVLVEAILKALELGFVRKALSANFTYAKAA